MQVRLMAMLLLYSINAIAVDDKSVQDLFKKYDLVMDQKKTELTEEVFSKKFLKESGGKEKFIAKVKELPLEKSVKKSVTWKKGLKGKVYFAKQTESSEFILVEEDGKLKIDGTLSDAN